MSAAVIDTFEGIFPPEQARALTSAFLKSQGTIKEALKKELVTKESLRAEMAELETRLSQRLIMWMVSLNFALFFGILGAMKMFLT